ncbi:PREDICTED: son of sevenless homolog 1-like isoform X2 [Amphimedon queenslandica]|uniref:PH domain-containing protein n=1 Tax=Amphimedon queenslandica TaxID=400682 RepID=A0A1X7ULA5_AMPQE|nr:PREDICTED: son of sevenless homolog 1-like isoform X2 [Amphimedon queenslandica]|eukprot:XP_003387588.1 PREDICTED: son of sevenless homolog 1-like isoform X2 [Amphimedon queenslandica]
MAQNNEIVKSGYLTKSPPLDAPSISQWRRRWFVLRDSIRSYPLAERYVRLEYYQNESEARKLSDPKGIVNLTECYRVSGSVAVKGHKYVFDVCTKDRKYHLAADTPSEKHMWIQTLNEVLFSTSVVPSQTKTQDLEDAEFQIQRRKSQSKAALKQISLENVAVDVTQRPLSCFEQSRVPAQPRNKRPLPPTPDQEISPLPIAMTNTTTRPPGSPIPKPRTKLDTSRSPISSPQQNGGLYSSPDLSLRGMGGGTCKGGDMGGVVPSAIASDYEVPVQSSYQKPMGHGRNSAPSLPIKAEETPPPPPPRRKGGSQGVPDSSMISVSEKLITEPPAEDYDVIQPAEDYDVIRYSPDNIDDDDEEEGAYGHLMKIGPIYEPHGDTSEIPLSVHTSLPCSFTPNPPVPPLPYAVDTKTKRTYYENTGFVPVREETYTKLSHFN